MEMHLKVIMVTIDQSHWRILELITIYQQNVHFFIKFQCATRVYANVAVLFSIF